MEYVQVNVETLSKYIPFVVSEYEFDCLDHMKKYYPIHVIYDYLNSLESFQYKNIWNMYCQAWEKTCNSVKSESVRGFNRSRYGKVTYDYIHKNMTCEGFNELVKQTLQDDMLLSIIWIRVILSHGHPKVT